MFKHPLFTASLLAVATACSEPTPVLRTCADDPGCGTGAYCSQSTCVVDAEAPALALSEPAEGVLVTSGHVSVAGTTSDTSGGGIATLEYSIDGVRYTPVAVADGSFTLDLALPPLDSEPLVVTLRATDRAGNVTTVSRTVQVDQVGPSMTFRYQPALRRFGASDVGSSVVVTVAAEDGSGTIRSTEYSLDSGATWTTAANATEFVVQHLIEAGAAPRTWVINVRSTDEYGNQAFADSEEIVIDPVAPVIEIQVPGEAGVVRGESVVMTGTYVEAAPTSFEYSLDGGPATPFTASDGALSVTLPLGSGDFVAHTVLVSITDLGGNRSTRTVQFRSDSQAPVIAVEGPVDDAKFSRADSGEFSLTGSASDAALASVTYAIDGAAPTALTLAAGRFDQRLPLAEEDYREHVMEVVATDTAGNAATATIHYAVDRVAPEPRLLSSPAGGVVISLADQDPFVFSGRIYDAAVAAAELAIDGVSAPLTLASDGSFELPWDVPDAEDGEVHALVVSASDRFGNIGRLVTGFGVDRVRPQLTVDSPAEDAACNDYCSGAIVNIADGSVVVLRGVARDGGLIDPPTVGFELTPETSGYPSYSGTATIANRAWSYEWADLPLVNGQFYNLTVRAKDNAGNWSSASRRLYVDRVPPSFVDLLPNKRLVAAQTPILGFSEPMHVGSVQGATTLNGQPVGSALTTTDGGMTFRRPGDLTPYSLQQLVVSLTATDRALNRLSAQVSFGFLTSPALPEGAVVANPITDRPCSHPTLTTDTDGLPTLLYYSSGGRRIAAANYDGSTRQFAVSPARFWDFPAIPESIQVHSYIQQDLRLTRRAFAAIALEDGSARKVELLRSLDLSNWISTSIGTTRTLALPSLSGDQLYYLTPVYADVNRYDFANLTGPHWACTFQGEPIAMRGIAIATTKDLVIMPGLETPGPQSLVGLDGASQALQVMGVGGPFRKSTLQVVGQPSPYVAWTWRRSSGTYALSMACQPPTGGAWQTEHFLIPDGSIAPTSLHLALGERRIAAAIKLGNRVYFGTGPNDSCSRSPLISSWGEPIPDAKDPAVYLDDADRLWGTYVDAAGDVIVRLIQ